MAASEIALKSDYSDFLTKYAGKICYVIPYPGNAGDGLIVAGTKFELERLQVQTTLCPRAADFLLFPGGTPALWKELLAVWEDYWARFPGKPFVVGPSTFQFARKEWAGLVNEKGHSVSAIFAREPRSFALLQSANLRTAIHLGLADDAAFFLMRSPLIASLKQAGTEEYNLYSFRKDHENTPVSALMELAVVPPRLAQACQALLQKLNYERLVHSAIQSDCSDRPKKILDAASLNFDLFLDTMVRASSIYTNRLHIMILGGLLGKSVFAYEVAFSKLKSVYDFSMRGYTNVQFCSRGGSR